MPIPAGANGLGDKDASRVRRLPDPSQVDSPGHLLHGEECEGIKGRKFELPKAFLADPDILRGCFSLRPTLGGFGLPPPISPTLC